MTVADSESPSLARAGPPARAWVTVAQPEPGTAGAEHANGSASLSERLRPGPASETVTIMMIIQVGSERQGQVEAPPSTARTPAAVSPITRPSPSPYGVPATRTQSLSVTVDTLAHRRVSLRP